MHDDKIVVVVSEDGPISAFQNGDSIFAEPKLPFLNKCLIPVSLDIWEKVMSYQNRQSAGGVRAIGQTPRAKMRRAGQVEQGRRARRIWRLR